ncbi:hypothetical protein VNO77_08799 [Canavalia gladiata]|uniref:Uncharacterized protein n=1 Tax=Canavalia gladiata TaxID=3824 RepID=A0AAN9MCG9_CANGL
MRVRLMNVMGVGGDGHRYKEMEPFSTTINVNRVWRLLSLHDRPAAIIGENHRAPHNNAKALRLGNRNHTVAIGSYNNIATIRVVKQRRWRSKPLNHTINL